MVMMWLALTYQVHVRFSHAAFRRQSIVSRLLTPLSPDRLPTVSASAALNSLENETHAYISTGVDDLDKSLLPQGQASAGGSISNGGVKRGQVTEIWGPPGTAKTSLGYDDT